MDIAEKILARQDDIYDGIIDLDDEITVTKFNPILYQYETIAVYKGEAARRYMDENGIY